MFFLQQLQISETQSFRTLFYWNLFILQEVEKEQDEKMIEFTTGPEISHTSLQLKEPSDDEEEKGRCF